MTQTVTLRIVGENGQLVGVIRASKAELDGLGKASGAAGEQARRAARGVDELGNASDRTRKRASLLNGTLGQLAAGFLGGAALVQTVRDLGRTADAYSDIDGKLKQVTNSERELAQARDATFRISQQYFQQWDATAQLYTRAAMTSDVLRRDQEKLGEVIETVSAALLVNRASTAESASAMLQLSQSIGSGVLRGEEFRAVYEAAPQLMQLLADSMGVPIGKMKELAEEGELTIDRMIEAFTGTKARELQARAADVPLTIGRAWQQVRNDVLRSIGETDQRIGASSAVADNLGSILLTLAKAAAAVAVVYAGRLVGAIAATTVEFVRHQRAATAAYLATMRLNAGMGTMPALMARVGAGVRGLGAGIVAFAGGPIGIAVIAIGALIAKFIAAKAEAEALKQSVAGAITASQNFQDTRDLGMALSAGKELLAQRQALEEDIAERRRALVPMLFSPAAHLSGARSDAIEELRQQEASLAEVNRQLAINADLIESTSAAQAARVAATTAAAKENAKFNESLADQNEKLKIERIEREQGIRAALEYQAMQAAGVTTVGQLSQATRDLIDVQVQELAAAEAYKIAQREVEQASKAATKATEEQRQAQAQYANALELARAELEGPLAVAQAEHDQAVRALDADYAAHNITLQAYLGLKDVEAEKLRRVRAAQVSSQDILDEIRASYEQQVHMAGLSAEAYRVEQAVLQAVNDTRQRGVPITAELTAAIRAQITTGEGQLNVAEWARRSAEDYRNSWLNAIDSVARAMGDWITGSISSLSDFGDALADIGKRWLSDLISQDFRQLFSGGFASAGTNGGGGILGALANASGGGAGGGFLNTIVGGVARLFGFGGGSTASAGGGWTNAYGAGTNMLAAGAGVLAPQYGGGTLVGGSGAGGFSSALSLFSKEGTMGKFLTSPVAPWLGAIGGALYGFNSTDDGLGKGLAGAAYGAAGYGVMAGVGAGLTASAAGATAGGAAMAGLGAIPVVGWIALASIAIDKISGGKLFGTKYKLDSASNSFTYGDSGFDGEQSVTKVRQRSLFRGRKWTTETSALSEEAQAAIDQAFAAIDDAVTQAAGNLGISAPDLLGASFKQEFDKKGNLKREFGTIAGRVYNEAQDAFNQRYLAENLLVVAGLAGGHATVVEQLANAYRGTPEVLTDFATLMLAIAGDAKAATLLWEDTDAGLVRAVGTLEDLQRAGESLAETYQRVTQGARAYGELIAGVRGELLTQGLSDFARAQLNIELQYREQVKQANDLAKALGLSGARAEDLAAIEQLRAQRMADLQLQMERQRDDFLGNLRLSDLGVGTDRDKLGDAMAQLQKAVAGGDLQRAQQLAQQALGFGRNLYASGSDYNALYGEVTGMLEALDPMVAGLTADALQQLADTMETLPIDIAAAMFELLSQQSALPPAPLPTPPGSTPPTAGSSGGTNGGSSNGGGTTDPTQAAIAANTAAAAAGIEELLRAQKLRDLREANA